MSGPHPAVAAHRAAVRRDLVDLPQGSLVLVACSGGQDSLALAAATAFVTTRAGLAAGAVVVDHGLQAASAEVAARAAAQCRALGLDPVDVVRAEVGSARGAAGPEAGARAARYAVLERVARDRGAVAVLLGHTLDDQAETVLLGLGRGSGARSLAGMAARRGLLRRPFLGVGRASTGDACAALGLDPWHDPTNGADHAAAPVRSRVRHEVLPVLEAVLGPGVGEALARTADQLRDDADLLDRLATDVLHSARLAGQRAAPVDHPGADGSAGGPAGTAAGPEQTLAALDVDVLVGAPAALRGRTLRAALIATGSPAGSLTRRHVEAVAALVLDWHGQGPVDLPGGVRAVRRYGRLLLLGGPGRGPQDARRSGAAHGGCLGHQ